MARTAFGNVFAFWMFLTLAVGVRAQTNDSVATPEEPFQTVEEIERLLADTDRTSSLPEEVKNQVTESYRQAIEALKRADSWRVKKDEFDAARESAPARLSETQAQRDALSEEVALDVDGAVTLTQLEQRLAQAESGLREARAAESAAEDEQSRRTGRRAELPRLIANARARLDALATDIAKKAPADQPQELSLARSNELRARRSARRAEVDCYETELVSYDARTELLRVRRELAARRSAKTVAIVQAWQDLVAEARRTEAQAAVREADRARREAARTTNPVLREMAKENAAWAERRARDHTADKIESTRQKKARTSELLEQLSREFSALTTRVSTAGVSPTIGVALRRLSDTLPNLNEYRSAAQRRAIEVAAVRLEWLDYQDAYHKLLAESGAQVQQLVASLDSDIPEAQQQFIATEARALLEARREYIEALIKDFDTYARALVDLDGEEQQLINLLDEIHDYISERILWIESASLPRREDLKDLAEAVAVLAAPDNWIAAGRSLGRTATHAPVRSSLFVLIVLSLFGIRTRVRPRIRALGEVAAQPFAHEFRPTLVTAALTVVLMLAWPALLWVIGWALETYSDHSEFAGALGVGMQLAAAWLLLCEFVRQVCRRGGLGEAHFGWSQQATVKMRRHITWFAVFSTVTVFISGYGEATTQEAWNNTLGRFAFVVGVVFGIVFVQLVLSPTSGVFTARLGTSTQGPLWRFRYWLYLLGMGSSILLGGLALFGYYYTTVRLAQGLDHSLWLILLIAVAHNLALRWVLVYRRSLSIRDYHKRLQAATEAGGTDADGAHEEPEPPVDLKAISAQVRSLLRAVGVFVFFIGLWAIWNDTMPALRMLDRVDLWTTMERVTVADDAQGIRSIERPVAVTLQDLGISIIIFVVTIIAVRNLPGLIEMTVLQQLQLGAAQRFAITTVSRYTMIVVGVITGFGVIGLGWAKVQWLAAAVTVGLGFGLQEIFANFVSGLIILFERPIRIGDMVTVGDVEGRITRIQMRATTITDWDMRELIVPNKEFITTRVINWTLSEPTTRVVIPVGIAYGSDTERATELLLEIAGKNPDVMEDPPPHVVFRAFGDSSLKLDLRVYLATRMVWPKLMHTMHTTIHNEFREAGIEIAFPQRDLHLRSINGPIHVDVQPQSDAPRGGTTKDR